MPDPDWWHALWPRPGEVLERLGIEPEAEVVDLCCGDGLFTIPLARMVRHVAAIDLDPAMLALARNRAFAEGLTNCTFTGGDVYDLAKLVAGHVDWVLIANTFHGVDAVARLPVECRLIAAAMDYLPAPPASRSLSIGDRPSRSICNPGPAPPD